MARRETLQQRRLTCELTQERLGETVGVNARTVRSWEAGTSTPSPEQRPPPADALHITMDDLHRVLDRVPTIDESGALAVVGGNAERLRVRLDASLSGTASPARLELVEQQVLDHLTDYTRTGRAEALASLIPTSTKSTPCPRGATRFRSTGRCPPRSPC